jgi:hypothetical protein
LTLSEAAGLFVVYQQLGRCCRAEIYPQAKAPLASKKYQSAHDRTIQRCSRRAGLRPLGPIFQTLNLWSREMPGCADLRRTDTAARIILQVRNFG